MKTNVLILILVSCLAMGLTAQENADVVNQQNLKPQLPKHEVALAVGDNMFHTQIYWGGDQGYGSYTLSYHYRIKKWLWCGGYLNAFPVGDRDYYWYDNNGQYHDYGKEVITTRASIAPSIRFSYFNTPLATLYSGVSVGWGMTLSSKMTRPELCLFFQTTFFGFSIGKKFFASGEIGIGYKGLLCATVGYKF